MPDIELMTITDADRCPRDSFPACSNRRKATVVKYTDETFVLNVSDHWENSSWKRRSLSSLALSLSGSALGPAMPALVIRRLMCFSFLLISDTRASRSFLEVTSQGPALGGC